MSTYGYLAHHGIKGQKWGIRRYQNSDGSLTAEGKTRYGYKGGSKKNTVIHHGTRLLIQANVHL